jgi:transposase
VLEILDSKKEGRVTSFLSRLASPGEPVWIKESNLRTEQNKAIIHAYQEKARAELERREEEVIRQHAAREIDRYRSVEARPRRERRREGEAVTQELPDRVDPRPAADAAADTEPDAAPVNHPPEKAQLTDAQRISIIQKKSEGLNATQIGAQLTISPSTIRSFLSRMKQGQTLHGTNGRPKKAPLPLILSERSLIPSPQVPTISQWTVLQKNDLRLPDNRIA